MIKKLFSDTGLLLKNYVFHAGINIILGKYSGNEKSEGINGIGKSSLIRLIDFTLLSDSASKIFYSKKYDFLRTEEHEIILEINIQNTNYFIKRDFNKKSEIKFGKQLHNLENFEKKDLKKILTNLFFPIEDNNIFFEGNRFRTLMNFNIKDDLDNLKRSEPFNFLKYNANAKEKAIYNFFILGLPTGQLINYNEQTQEHKRYTDTIKSIGEKIKIDTGKSVDEYKRERSKIKKRIDKLETSLEEYKFISNYQNIETKIIDFTRQINAKLTEYNSLDKKLNKIKESYSYNKEVDTKEIRKIYNEVIENFGNFVAKTIDEVVEFKNNIYENRKKYFIQKENKLDKAISEVLKKISNLEIKRSAEYKKLDEKGALDSVKNTYEELIIEKTDLEKNLQLVKQIDEYTEMLSNLNVTISKTRELIQIDIRKFELNIEELRTLFHDILNNAIFVDKKYENAYFDIIVKPTTNQNHLPFKMEVNIPKADALGQSRLRIVAYDLMAFLNNIQQKRKVPNFLIHDGAFHGISHETKINTLNYVFHKFLKYAKDKQFQYILTFNEDEITVPEDKISEYGVFDFNFKHMTIAEFEDIPEKMIFKRAFE